MVTWGVQRANHPTTSVLSSRFAIANFRLCDRNEVELMGRPDEPTDSRGKPGFSVPMCQPRLQILAQRHGNISTPGASLRCPRRN